MKIVSFILILQMLTKFEFLVFRRKKIKHKWAHGTRPHLMYMFVLERFRDKIGAAATRDLLHVVVA